MINLNPTAAARVDEASAEYMGRWNRLVSTTNWEKGRIIFDWRQALIAGDAPSAEYSDDAWSRRVGNVTGQHVGRLRRVFERFGESRERFPNLFWSHFTAAIDWDDAPMWLEGAVQNQWSVADMRRQRWQSLGAVESLQPSDDDVVSAEMDEDFDPQSVNSPEAAMSAGGSVQSSTAERRRKDAEEQSDAGDDDGAPFDTYDSDSPPAAEPVRPFASLPDLPDDLSEAFEAFKLAIVRHKLSGWQDVSRADVLASLDALQQLALAPVE